jgi:hypothetical protein
MLFGSLLLRLVLLLLLFDCDCCCPLPLPLFEAGVDPLSDAGDS